MELKNVTRVYTGKPGCMCGCNGQYRMASAHVEKAAAEQGYPVAEDEISDRSVKIVFNKIMKNPLHKYDAEANCVYVQTETRNLVAYFA
jgi:hypothetical protein